MQDADSQLAALGVRVTAVESLAERLRARSHEHAGLLTEHKAALGLVQELREDVRLLLRRQWAMTGALALVAFVAPILARWIGA